jgi:PAS domain S-box-containing protein
MRNKPVDQSSQGSSISNKATPVCSFRLDMTGMVTEATTCMLKILGYAREEFIGHNIEKFFPHDGDDPFWMTRLLGRDIGYHRALLMGKDDIARPVRLFVSGEYILGWLPRTTCLVEMNNILHSAEAKSQSIMSQFQAVLGSMEGGAYGVDMEGRCIFINETGASFLGLHTQEVLGLAIHSLITCDSHDAAWALMDGQKTCHGFRPGKGCPTEGVTVWKRHGATALIEYSSAPITQGGDIAGTVVTFTDISTRGRTIQTLRENVETFRHLAQFSREVFWILDPKSKRMLYVSPEYEATWGRTAKTLYTIPGAWFAHMHPEDKASLQHIPESSSEGYEIEYRIVRPDSSIRWIRDRAYPMRNASGALYRMAGIAEDITEYKAATESLQNSLARSQALSCYTEKAREEERFRIGQEIHDNLGNVLTYLKLDLTRLGNQVQKGVDGKVSAHLKDKIEAMVKATDMAIKSVQRVGMQLRPIVLEQFGLVAALEWQAKEFERHTGIHCLFTESVDTDFIDQNHSILLFRIVQEALTNVARHAQANNVTVAIMKGDDHVFLRIEDNGRGISDVAFSDPTSFGLMGMRERARLAGGVLLFDSSAQKGTTLTVQIPIEELKKCRRPSPAVS